MRQFTSEDVSDFIPRALGRLVRLSTNALIANMHGMGASDDNMAQLAEGLASMIVDEIFLSFPESYSAILREAYPWLHTDALERIRVLTTPAATAVQSGPKLKLV